MTIFSCYIVLLIYIFLSMIDASFIANTMDDIYPGLGSKKFPIHLLVPHGSLLLSCPSPVDYSAMVDWFNSEGTDAQVEGIVWHCSNGALYKVFILLLNKT